VRRALLLLLVLLAPSALRAADAPIVVGSKNFGESYLLAEIVARLLEGQGLAVERRTGLGGTLICYEALRTGEIDVYVEYTGTITQAILEADVPGTRAAIAGPLAALGLRTLGELGFDNTYAIAMEGERAAAAGIARISDLRGRDDLEIAFSHEFVDREDGWRGLRAAYDLDLPVRGIEHGLAYQAIAAGRIDVTDAYSTDGDLERYGLVVLEDDADFFPRYAALPLVREDFPRAAEAALARLEGRLDEDRMRTLNARVSVNGEAFDTVAAEFLAAEGLDGGGGAASPASGGRRSDLVGNTLVHLQLTGIALGLAVLVGLPLGILVHASPRASRVVLYGAGLLQTIPSIALLALLIPLLGIGWAPAVVALFLYSLLPILRSTVTALLTVDPLLRRVALGMGLTARQQIRWLLLPLAMPNVLAGVRTAAVISIGTATLAAFVGAGGLGQPIVTGLSLNDPALILEGAVPAALLAVLTELLFEGVERALVPAHLRRDPFG
jgi:osmoprotectant transport system permease protein